MTVDSKHHRYFVAKRGEILRNIGEEFGGVVVSFPRPGVTSDKVIILNNAMNTQYLGQIYQSLQRTIDLLSY